MLKKYLFYFSILKTPCNMIELLNKKNLEIKSNQLKLLEVCRKFSTTQNIKEH